MFLHFFNELREAKVRRDALAEAEGIINEAREEAKRIEANVQERTEATLKRREQQAIDMIAAAEERRHWFAPGRRHIRAWIWSGCAPAVKLRRFAAEKWS